MYYSLRTDIGGFVSRGVCKLVMRTLSKIPVTRFGVNATCESVNL